MFYGSPCTLKNKIKTFLDPYTVSLVFTKISEFYKSCLIRYDEHILCLSSIVMMTIWLEDKLRKFKMKFQFIKRLGSLLQFLNNNFRNFYPWTYKNTFTSCQSNFWFRIRWKRWRLNHHRNSMERWPRFRRWFSGFRIGKSAQACRSIFRRRGHPNYEGQVDQTSKIVHWSIPTITGKVNITVMHLNLKKDNQRNFGNQFLWYISTIRNAE